MQPINSSISPAMFSATQPRGTAPLPEQAEDKPLREAFDSFVGETFYTQMLSSMRKTQGKPAYFHGGRAEEIFQGQLDQVLAEQMTTANAETFTGPMFELFSLNRA